MVKVTRPINAVTYNAPYAGRGITIFLKLVFFFLLLHLNLMLNVGINHESRCSAVVLTAYVELLQCW